MPSDFVISLLKKWQVGKKLSKSQYAELIRDGLLEELDAAKDTYAITEHGRTVLHQTTLNLK